MGSVTFSSIFAQTAAKQVARRISNTAIEAGVNVKSIPDIIEAVQLTLVGVPGQGATLSGVSATVFDNCVSAARYGYAYGFRMTWLASIPFGVIALVCAAAVRDPSKYFTNHVEIHLNKKVGGKYEAAEGHQVKEVPIA